MYNQKYELDTKYNYHDLEFDASVDDGETFFRENAFDIFCLEIIAGNPLKVGRKGTY